ncbi:MAG: hypothetical protein Q8M79_09240 [Dehalococcoidia bacterium]|nr:hypothetical protein [Dehalococcoidia bacterium]
MVDAHPLAVGFAARQRWLQGERPAARELYGLANLAEAWQRVVEACPIVEERDLPRRRLLVPDCLPVIQEILLAAHFLRAGFPVDPICLHSSGNPDLVVTCDDSQVSIEIKTIEQGTGMKIHARAFRSLALEVFGLIREAEGSFVATLRCPERLKAEDVAKVAARFAGILSAKLQVMNAPAGEYRIDVERLGSTVTKEHALARYGWELTRQPLHPPHAAFWDIGPLRDDAVAFSEHIEFGVLLARSEQADAVGDAIRSRIRGAARQLAPGRPGIVNIHLREETPWADEALRRRVEQIVHEACSWAPSLAPNLVMLSSAPGLRTENDIVDTGASAYYVPFDSKREPLSERLVHSLVARPPDED